MTCIKNMTQSVGIIFKPKFSTWKNMHELHLFSTLNMWLFYISLFVTFYISKKIFYNIPICSLSNEFETSLCILAKSLILFLHYISRKQSQYHCENMNCHVGKTTRNDIFINSKKWHKIKYQMQSIIRFEMQVSIVKTKESISTV